VGDSGSSRGAAGDSEGRPAPPPRSSAAAVHSSSDLHTVSDVVKVALSPFPISARQRSVAVTGQSSTLAASTSTTPATMPATRDAASTPAPAGGASLADAPKATMMKDWAHSLAL